MHKVYVAGPVLRPGRSEVSSSDLSDLYHRMSHAAAAAGVSLELPLYDARLDDLAPESFRQAIQRRILEADSLVALISVPGATAATNLSIGWEAQYAAHVGKTVALVAGDPPEVPRLVYALAVREIEPFATVDFRQVFALLASRPPLAAPVMARKKVAKRTAAKAAGKKGSATSGTAKKLAAMRLAAKMRARKARRPAGRK